MAKTEAAKTDPIRERIEKVLGKTVEVENATAQMLKPEDFRGGKVVEFRNRFATRAKDKDVFALTLFDVEKQELISMLETFQLAALHSAGSLKEGVVLYIEFKLKRQIAGGSKTVNEFDVRLVS